MLSFKTTTTTPQMRKSALASSVIEGSLICQRHCNNKIVENGHCNDSFPIQLNKELPSSIVLYYTLSKSTQGLSLCILSWCETAPHSLEKTEKIVLPLASDCDLPQSENTKIAKTITKQEEYWLKATNMINQRNLWP